MSQKKYLIIANWKMNFTLNESLVLAKQYKKVTQPKNVEVIVAPSYPALLPVAKIFQRSGIKLAAQNSAAELRGAYTGEVSPLMLKELGCTYVILGHSERKKYYGEDLNLISTKVATAVGAGLVPIVCVGETWEERKAGLTSRVLKNQVKAVLKNIRHLPPKSVIISYEPFWTISTSHGRIATSQEIESSCRAIRQTLADIYGPQKAERSCRLIYGGTVEADTVDEFLSLKDISGFLVGSASKKVETFGPLLSHF